MRNLTEKTTFLVLALFLGACATNPEMRILQACQGYASTLSSLAVAKTRGQLSTDEILAVDALRPSLNRICIDGDYADPFIARQIVQDAMIELIRIEVRNGS